MIDNSLVPSCPTLSMISVAAICCVVADSAQKAGLDPVGEAVKRLPTEPSLAEFKNKESMPGQSARGLLLSDCRAAS